MWNIVHLLLAWLYCLARYGTGLGVNAFTVNARARVHSHLSRNFADHSLKTTLVKLLTDGPRSSHTCRVGGMTSFRLASS